MELETGREEDRHGYGLRAGRVPWVLSSTLSSGADLEGLSL